MFCFTWFYQKMPVYLPVSNLIISVMKYNVKFFLDGLDKSLESQDDPTIYPLYMTITYSGDRVRFFTGYRLERKYFIFSEDTGLHMIKKNGVGYKGEQKVKYNEINSKMETLRETVKSLLNIVSIAPEKNIIKKCLSECLNKAPRNMKRINNEFWDTFERYCIEVKVSDLRRKQLRSCMNAFKNYEANIKGQFTFKNVNANTIKMFEQYLLNETKEVLINGKKEIKVLRGQNHVTGILKRLRAFFNWAILDAKQRQTGENIPYPFEDFSITKEVYSDPIFLTKQEREQLYAFDPGCDRLRRIRDIFVFQCLVGCRVGDLAILEKKNVYNGVLRYVPSKTRGERLEEVDVKLNDTGKEILAKYANIKELGERLLPVISDQRYNDYLKELFKKAGLNRIVMKMNPTTGVMEPKHLYEVASSHMARRTFVGVLYCAGVKDDVIGSMSGHKEGSNSFKRYRKVTDALKENAIDQL